MSCHVRPVSPPCEALRSPHAAKVEAVDGMDVVDGAGAASSGEDVESSEEVAGGPPEVQGEKVSPVARKRTRRSRRISRAQPELRTPETSARSTSTT